MDGLIAFDAIEEMIAGNSARAVRAIPSTLAIFDTHFPRFPVLPGVLLLRGLGRLGEVLLAETTGRRWRLESVNQLKFRRYVRPGDRVDFKVDIGELSEEVAVLRGVAEADGRACVVARRLRFVPTSGGV